MEGAFRPAALLGACLAVALMGSATESSNDNSLSIPTKMIAEEVHMPVLSIGTGGLESGAAESIVTAWVGLGGRGIDTAWIYRNQDSVREALAKTGVPREQLFITSKIPGCAGACEFVEEDLKQLGVDYIDLLLIHSPRPSPQCAATWAALEQYHAKGVLKAIGVSNFQTQDLEALLKSAKVMPAVNQIEHNVLHHDDQTTAFCSSHNITVEAYSPLGRSGRSGDIPGNKVVQAIAANHNVTPYQVALKWILQHGHLSTFQSSSAAHQAVDADLFSFTLMPQEMAQLDSLQADSALATAPTVFI